MESSRRDGYDGYFTWGGALLQPELWGKHPKIAISGHKATIFTRDNDILYLSVLGNKPAIWVSHTIFGIFSPCLQLYWRGPPLPQYSRETPLRLR